MSDTKQVTITVSRVTFWTVGVRLWFVVQATDGTRYQRWSLVMDSTDECLLIAQKGDTLNLEYKDAEAKNTIITAEFK